MRRSAIVTSFVALVSAAGIASAQAGQPPGIQVKPGTFQGAGSTDTAVAQWVAQQGLPDAGKSDHALYLQKSGPTADNSAAGASVTGVEGTTLTELGFDVRSDGHCGAGAPRSTSSPPTAPTTSSAASKSRTRPSPAPTGPACASRLTRDSRR